MTRLTRRFVRFHLAKALLIAGFIMAIGGIFPVWFGQAASSFIVLGASITCYVVSCWLVKEDI